MSTFKIDFTELAFLAEACIPPRPIARSMFWNNLTDVYWEQMTDNERNLLFEWIQKNPYYEISLEKEDNTKIFHNRFNPDNQYLVTTDFNDELKEYRVFKMGDRFYINSNTSIQDEYITKIEKL